MKTNRPEGIHYTYIMQCSDGTLYTGYTTDLVRREKEHNEGSGAKYTRVRRPVKLVYYEEYATKSEAMKREYQIKQLTRKDKLLLLEESKKLKSSKLEISKGIKN